MPNRDLTTCVEELALSGSVALGGNPTPATVRAWARDLNAKLEREKYDWRVACDVNAATLWQVSVGEHEDARGKRPAAGKTVTLKPCPFCKGKPRRHVHAYTGNYVTNPETGEHGWENLKYYVVKCTACGISQPRRTYHTRKESDDAWNERA